MRIFFTIRIMLFFGFILPLSQIQAMDKRKFSTHLPYQMIKRKKIEIDNHKIIPTVNQISQINNFDSPIDALTYDENNNIIALSSGQIIRCFDVASGNFRYKYERKRFQCEYCSIAFSQDSKLFGGHCFGDYIAIWNKEGKRIACFPVGIFQQYAPLKFTQNLLLIPHNNNLMIYELNNKIKLQQIHRPTIRTALLSPDTSKLATIMQNDYFQIENWPTMRKLMHYTLQNIYLLRWSPDSNKLAISYTKEQKSYTNIVDIEKKTVVELNGHFCSWSPKSNCILISDRETYLRNEKITMNFYNLITKKCLSWYKNFKANKINAKICAEWTKKCLFLTTQDNTVHLLSLPVEFYIDVLRMQSNAKFADVTFQF